MKVRMKVALSGGRNGKPWPGVGEVADLPAGEAADLCASGIAAPVAELSGEVETTTMPQEDTETRQEASQGEAEAQQEEKPKRRGRPKLPRDEHGNVIRD